MRVSGKSIIVTGAGGGIGEGIARRLAAEGAAVIVNDINATLGEKVTADITAAGGRARFVAGDVTQGDDWHTLVAAAQDFGGRLDVIVNNAGWTHRNRPMLEVSEAEFDKVYAVNMKSIYWSALHGVPAMKQAGGGDVGRHLLAQRGVDVVHDDGGALGRQPPRNAGTTAARAR